jgi:Xaa-Pro aminopeptidase
MIKTKKILLLVGLIIISAHAVLADDNLPIGHPPVFSLPAFCFQMVLTVCALVLLFAGCRLPRFLAALISLAFSLALALRMFSGINYLLAFVMALLIYSLIMWIALRFRRIFMGFVMLFIPLILYGLWMAATGAFPSHRLFLLIGANVSAVFGIIFPIFSLSVAAPVLGCLLGYIVIPGEVPFWLILIILFSSITWQMYLWYRQKFPLAFYAPFQSAGSYEHIPYLSYSLSAALSHFFFRTDDRPVQSLIETRKLRKKLWHQSIRTGDFVLLIFYLFLIIFSPHPAPSSSEEAKRMEQLKKSGALSRPGFIFSADDGFYLFGKPYPVALVGTHNSFLDRGSALILSHNISRKVHEMRTVKDSYEIKQIQKASEITARALEDVKPLIKTGINESDLEKAILESFRKYGATGVAFKSIVGSGKNAILPHYQKNNAVVKNGFVVIDIGAMYNGYCSDMTRTYPVNGVFTKAERHLMDLVLQAKKQAVAALKPGATLSDIDKISHDVIDKAGFGPYYNHFVGHHVGINVHDAHSEVLKEGMVVTIEPGIYIPAGAPLDPSYWNLGVRMEDTYLITKEGGQILTFDTSA